MGNEKTLGNLLCHCYFLIEANYNKLNGLKSINVGLRSTKVNLRVGLKSIGRFEGWIKVKYCILGLN
jgi:hypothetical protein